MSGPVHYTVHLTSPDAAKQRLRMSLRLLGFTDVRIVEAVSAEPKQPKPKKDNVPTSPEALAVAALFRRRPETAWSDAEIKSFTAARKAKLLTVEDMIMIAKYYAAERAKGEEGRHRRDLGTFLNHAGGELDRATAFAATKQHGAAAKPYNVVPMPAPPPTAEELAEHERYQARLAEAKARKEAV